MSDSEDDSVSLDVSDDERPTPIALPTTQVTMFDLRQALEKSQRQSLHLFEKNKTLRLHISDLSSRLMAAKTRKRRKKNSTHISNDPALDHFAIVKLGKSYTVLVSPWIAPNAFLKPLPPNAPAPNSKERVQSERTYRDGMVIELHYHLKEPGLCQKAEMYPPFRTAFRNQVRQERGTLIKTVRECAPIIFKNLNIPVEIWNCGSSSQRHNSARCKSLLKFPDSQIVLSPIFYPNGVKDHRVLFCTEELPQMLRAILFGKASLTSLNFKFGPGLLGMMWEVKNTNAACVALTAIVTQFLLSEDQVFEEVGGKSKINYHQNFFLFKRLLVLAEGTEYSRMLYKFWDSRVFTGLAAAGENSAGDLDGAVDELAEAMVDILRFDSEPQCAVTTQPETEIVELTEVPNELASIDSVIASPSVMLIPVDQSNNTAAADTAESLENTRGAGSGRGKKKSRGTQARKAKTVQASNLPEQEPEPEPKPVARRRTARKTKK
ncbi:hypothetical protein V5O48_017753 [Marasmius crinis-equi]|uniref:Uncharacterized protein n=1 Tax=Marasmius crinis-equi TaxID=585013 RepID=A0ABR3EN44_9AGAR